MHSHKLIRRQFIGPYFYLGIALGLLYWLFDAWVMAAVFSEGNWASQVITPDTDDLYMRSFTWALFAFSGGMINALLNQVKAQAAQHDDLIGMLATSLNEIYIFDQDSLRFLHVNRGARENLGYTEDELAELTVLDLKPTMTPREFKDLVQPLISEETNKLIFETVHRRKDGTDYPVEVHLQRTIFANKPALYAIVIDTTERKLQEKEKRHLETLLWHAQKVESLERMAGSMTHHFNNLLTIGLGNCEQALNTLPRDSSAYRFISAAHESASRGAAICDKLLDYTGKRSYQKNLLDLSATLQSLRPLISASCPTQIQFDWETEPDLPLIYTDVRSLEQIVMTLIANSIEAIGEQQGVISLHARLLSPSKKPGDGLSTEMQNSSQIQLLVSDTGVGMDEQTRERIFDPFFSTKFTGRGLGLASVHGIVNELGGSIDVQSTPGEGTSIAVLLPAAKDSETDLNIDERESIASNDEALNWPETGKVLVVDDEEMIGELAQGLLESTGLQVLRANNGAEGVELFRKHATELSLVILDLMMPVMNGAEAFALIRTIDPSVPVLISSGYNDEETHALFNDEQPDSFLPKPYQVDSFMRTVSKVLQPRPS